MKRDFRRHSLKNKIIILNLILTSLILIINLIHFRYNINYIKNSVKNTFEVVNFQIIQNLNSYIQSFENITLMMMHSEGFQEILREDYGEARYPQYEKMQDQKWIKEELLSFYYLYNEMIESIIVYVEKSGMIVAKGRNIERDPDYTPFNEGWYHDIIKAQGKAVVVDLHTEFQADPDRKDVVSIGRSIRNLRGELMGVIVINVNPDSLAGLIPEKTLIPGSVLMIIDGNNRLLYSNTGQGMDRLYDRSLFERDSIHLQQNLPDTRWQVINTIPEEFLYRQVNLINNFILLFVGVFTLLIFFFSVKISCSITSPLEELDQAMHRVRNGDLSTSVLVKSNDEIGYLSETFNSMVKQVNQLLSQAVAMEKEKRQAEMKFLLNQIKPHFIYNTLNMIKRMAQFQGARNIHDALDHFISILKMVTTQSAELITLEKEMGFIESYLSLLMIRYLNVFEFTIDLDISIREIKIPKLLLQPFVENSVFHGFQNGEGNYFLSIEGRDTPRGIRITICDNGRGFQDRASLPTSPEFSDSIGIANVEQRLKMYYGSDACLTVNSSKEQTTVELILPHSVFQGSQDVI